VEMTFLAQMAIVLKAELNCWKN